MALRQPDHFTLTLDRQGIEDVHAALLTAAAYELDSVTRERRLISLAEALNPDLLAEERAAVEEARHE